MTSQGEHRALSPKEERPNTRPHVIAVRLFGERSIPVPFNTRRIETSQVKVQAEGKGAKGMRQREADSEEDLGRTAS